MNDLKTLFGDIDGSLGMDALRLFEKIIINFDEMFVEIEQ